MASRKVRVLSVVVGWSAVALLGCGEGLNGGDDIQKVPGDVDALVALPDATSAVPFEAFSDNVTSRAANRSRTLIRNARGYQTFFGHAPPAVVDFSHEWVMFYAPGSQPTDGYDARFLALFRGGASLVTITQLVSPGPTCPVTAGATTPYALIKFEAQPGASAQFYRSDGTTNCDPATVHCTGLTAQSCPGQSRCFDDPSDSCDPFLSNDCPGLCSCVQSEACAADSQFDSTPAVCACVPIDSCATVKCAGGTHCDAGACVDNGLPCGGVSYGPCPGSGKCHDNPYDTCDPTTGAVDCPGLCSCDQSVVCPPNSIFNSSPSVCACVTVPADGA
jgi:hypothetical protein